MYLAVSSYKLKHWHAQRPTITEIKHSFAAQSQSATNAELH